RDRRLQSARPQDRPEGPQGRRRSLALERRRPDLPLAEAAARRGGVLSGAALQGGRKARRLPCGCRSAPPPAEQPSRPPSWSRKSKTRLRRDVDKNPPPLRSTR